MRVIAGTARKLRLKTIGGLDTRPTTDRIKETLFNMIQTEVPGSVFLDLFAGSGGIGIEALSRGAKEAVFIEQNRDAFNCIRDNLNFTRLADRAELYKSDVISGLRRLKRETPFDIVFMDPPYQNGLEREVMTFFADSELVHSDTLFIIEADIETDFSWLDGQGYQVLKYKRYKTNMHVFAERQGDRV